MPLYLGSRILYGPSGTAPTSPSPTEGSEWWDSTNDKKKIYNGTEWQDVGVTGGINMAALDSTFMYFDFGNYSTSSWQGNTSATTLTNIESGSSTQGVNLPRGSSAAYNSANGGILRGSGTQDVRTTISGTNPQGSGGMSMGVVVRFDSGTDGQQSPSRGVIYFGNTGTNQHFYVRKNFGTANNVSVGQDTNTNDVWTTAFSSMGSGDGFTVFVFNHASDGTLTVSKNGGAFSTIISA